MRSEAAKPNMEMCVLERYETGRVERGQRNKQGRMEDEGNQLYRRPKMTGQAMDEEETDMEDMTRGLCSDQVKKKKLFSAYCNSICIIVRYGSPIKRDTCARLYCFLQ